MTERRHLPLFLVWGPPSHGPRSRVMARELAIDVEFVHVTDRRGGLVAPYKYARQALATLRILRQRRPSVLFVQSPPTPAVLLAWMYRRLAGAPFVVDAHSAAMLSPWWTRPRWLHRALSRAASFTIVTSRHFADQLESWGAAALVVPDIPTTFAVDPVSDLPAGFNVLVVNTFSPDEPLAEVVEAARRSPGVTFHVTGRHDRHPNLIPPGLPENVVLTGYLPDSEYYGLMATVDAVMCLTTRAHTMQRGACEALSMGRPIITSDWPLLRSYFWQGAIHVDNTATGIAGGVEAAADKYADLERGITKLQEWQREQWHEVRSHLFRILDSSEVRR